MTNTWGAPTEGWPKFCPCGKRLRQEHEHFCASLEKNDDEGDES